MNDKILDQDLIPPGNESPIFVLRNVATKEEAEEMISLLGKSGIEARYSKDAGDLDYVFQGETPLNKFEIHIHESDREKAEQLFEELAHDQLEKVESDYYLFGFTNDELLDVLIQKNEWSEFDVLLSGKLLKERGVEIDQNILYQKIEQRDQELAKPEGGQTIYIFIGYLSAVLGGFLGLIIGYFIWQAKNKLPNGTKVYAYNDKIRNHGKIIFYISLIIFPTVVLIRVLSFLADRVN